MDSERGALTFGQTAEAETVADPAGVRGAVQRLVRQYHTPTGKKLARYTMVSVISAAVSFATLFIVFGLLHLWTQVPSVIFANTVASVPSYLLNRQWTWGKTGKSHLFKEVIPFWATSLAGMALAILAAAWAHQFTVAHSLHHFVATVIVLGANFAAFGVLWLGKFVIFNRLFHTGAATDLTLAES
jgi:putative flippase GtrA